MRWLSILLCVLALAACGQTGTMDGSQAPAVAGSVAPLDQPDEIVPPATARDLYASELQHVLAGDWRSAADRALDAGRQPQAMFSFFGITPDLSVIEIDPGDGWYAGLLAPWLAARGSYVASVPGEAAAAHLQAWFKVHRQIVGQASVAVYQPAKPQLGMPGSVDRVFSFGDVSHWLATGRARHLFAAVFDVLRPGGTFGVVLQREATIDGKPVSVSAVVSLARSTGFVLAAAVQSRVDPAPASSIGSTEAVGDVRHRVSMRFVKPVAPPKDNPDKVVAPAKATSAA